MTGEIIQALSGATYPSPTAVILNTKTDVLLGALIGAIVTIFLQLIVSIVLYHFIEKKKLAREREFSFKKEKIFKLQENFEKIVENFSSIEDYITKDIDRWQNFDRGTLKFVTKLRSLIMLHNIDAMKTLEEYLVLATDICNHNYPNVPFDKLLESKNTVLNAVKFSINELEKTL